MAVFKAFKPEAMNKIAKSMGYTGNMAEFQDFIEQDPARKARMQQFTNAAVQMAKGGVVKMQTGGSVQLPQQAVPTFTMPQPVTTTTDSRKSLASEKHDRTVNRSLTYTMFNSDCFVSLCNGC